MALLTERTEQDKIEILSSGMIQVRTATIIERDGVEISRSYHRHVVDFDTDLTNESDEVKGFAAVAHTPAKVAAYRASQASAVTDEV